VATVYDLTLDQLTQRLGDWGEPPFRAKQIHRQLWHRAATYDRMPDVPKRLRDRLEAELPIGVDVLEERTADRGATRKALLRIGGRHLIETVMGCGFCATGQMGLRNNLTAGEIAAQAVWARREAAALPDSTPRRLSNAVFMGMGEPLSNERHTFGALDLLTGQMGMGDRHVTVSTVGVAPAIRRLGEAYPQVGLAVSLHAADDGLRNELVPVNRLWPLDELIDAIEAWRGVTRRRPSIEWAMIDRTNDADDQAERLAPIALRLRAHVNLIPLNPTPGYATRGSSPAAVRTFHERLRALGVNATVRRTRGTEIDAACGQLRATAVALRPP
jgi:23S rRNA (adenine2503-C2)-methyltransferase